jgi:glycosyltransferase involved in cell wall biosynthesis
LKRSSIPQKIIDLFSPVPTSLYQTLGRKFGLINQPTINYVTPDNGWVTDWVGKYITDHIKKNYRVSIKLICRPNLVFNQIIHYGELGAFLHRLGTQHINYNLIIVTIFHGDRSEDYPELFSAVNQLIENANIPIKFLITCKIMEERLLKWGIPKDKIICIPLGVDLNKFKPTSAQHRLSIRKLRGIPDEAFCIGSFQKDGVGWGEGLIPKLIKGPDIFLQVLEYLQNRYKNLFILLSAPARGYIKSGLDSLGIQYHHEILPDYPSIIDLYHCLDTYLITSRDEGGPMSILESMACGIPIVSTRVGLAPDVIKHKHNGLLADIEDSHTLVENIIQLIENKNLRSRIIANGINDIKPYDWETIARRYYNELYKPLLDSMQ